MVLVERIHKEETRKNKKYMAVKKNMDLIVMVAKNDYFYVLV